MNKIVVFAAAVLILFSACKKKKETEPELYYMVFSADGVPSSFYEVSGTRGNLEGDTAVTFFGNLHGRTKPTLKIFIDAFDGYNFFYSGTNFTIGNGPYGLVEYTDSDGTVYSTANNEDGERINLLITGGYYEAGSTMSGTFSGDLRNGDSLIPINGKFRVKFEN